MIAAFARAARVLVDSPRRSEWRDVAVRAAAWIREKLWRAADRRLYRRYRDEEAAVDAFCEDYAYLAWGLIELFQATGDAAWLTWARDLVDVQTSLFYDTRDGGWFSTTGEDRSVLLRVKEDYDGAEPAAASVTVRNLITLGHLLGDEALTTLASRTLERYGPHIGRAVRVMPLMVTNIVLWHGGGTQIVVAGHRDADDTRALERAVAHHDLPWAVSVPVDPTTAATSPLPWLRAMALRDGHAAAYVCSDFTCQAPVTDAAALDAQIEDLVRGKRVG
jgi:uncharacterized protein YyaL (SSP411 family)